LSEFKSEVDKARVRENLGIPDEYTLYWGNMKGNIANQEDLIQLISELHQGINNTFSVQITTLQDNVASLLSNQLRQNNEIASCLQVTEDLRPYLERLSGITRELDALRTDVAQNATAISMLGGGDDIFINLPDKITTVQERINELSGQIAANTARSNTNASDIAAVRTQVNLNSTNITALQSQIARIGDLTNITGLNAQVEANTAQIGNLSTRCNSLDSLLVALRDAVTSQTSDVYALRVEQSNIRSDFQNLNLQTQTLATTVAALQEFHNRYDSASMFAQISSNSANIAALQTLLGNIPNQQNILARLANLEAKLSEVVLTDLIVSQPYISVTSNSDPVQLTITAKYSSGSVQDVTNSCSASSSNNAVAYWNTGSIIIAGAGTAIITFSYNGFTATTTITIADVQEVTPSYIGYAMTAEEVVLNPQCKITGTLGGSYNAAQCSEAPYYLWIITPLVLRTFLENNMWAYEVPGDNIELTYGEFNGVTYNVYKFHGDGLFDEPDTLNEPTTITISTN
jgi:predicted  nucleic acid-binding Zn-ribbon protein